MHGNSSSPLKKEHEKPALKNQSKRRILISVTKEQVFEVLVLFRETYNNFHFDQSKINIWHDLLKDKDPEVIKKTLEDWY